LLISLKEYGAPLDEFVNFLFGVDDALEPFIDFYRDIVEPIQDAIDDALNAVDQALFDGLFAQLDQTTQLMSATLTTALEAMLVKNVDLFYPFYPKLQQGGSEDEWYWFDTWHYLHNRPRASLHLHGEDEFRRDRA